MKLHLTVEFDEERLKGHGMSDASVFTAIEEMLGSTEFKFDLTVLEEVWVVNYDREQNMFNSNIEVLGVFSSEELAKEFKAEWLANWEESKRPAECWVDVDEWELDEVEL